MGRSTGLPLELMQAVDAVNDDQKQVLFDKICDALRRDAGGQDDRRLGPGVQAADRRHPRSAGPDADRRACWPRGASVRVHDPEAMANVRRVYGDKLYYADRPYGALEGADGLVVVTEWQEFRNPDFEVMQDGCSGEPVIFDGRNLYDTADGNALASPTTASAAANGRRGNDQVVAPAPVTFATTVSL